MPSSSHKVYLDHSATTPLADEVYQAMEPFLKDYFANPSSVYQIAGKSRLAIRKARRSIAEILNRAPEEIIFTGSATESNNAALWGTALSAKTNHGQNHLIIGGGEHPSVYECALKLKKHLGVCVTELPINPEGFVDIRELESLITDETFLVSLIYGNNEVGTLQNMEEIGSLLKERKILFHLDAVQAAGWCPIDIEKMNADLMSFSAHKFYGPKGCGLLFKRSGIGWVSLLSGGSQENGFRAGTENPPAAVGTAKAFELNTLRRDKVPEVQKLRDRLITEVLKTAPEIRLSGSFDKRLPFHASFIIPGLESGVSMMKFDLEGFCVSNGSACSVGNPMPSRVLLNMGFSPEEASTALRITLGFENTEQEIRSFIECFKKILTA